MNNLVQWIVSSVLYATILTYGCIGETLTEKTGHLNLGVPGIMFLGAFFSFAGAFLYEKSTPNPSDFALITFSLLSGFLAGAFGNLIYCFLVDTFKSNQNVTGLAITQFGVGVGSFGGFYLMMTKGGGTTAYAKAANKVFNLNLYNTLGITGDGFFAQIAKIFLSYGFMTYLAVILAICMHVYFKRTRSGLNLRAIGENPGTADAVGINVTKYQYLSTLIGGGICALGGITYILALSGGGWSDSANIEIEGLGWLAVALVIFSSWKPVNALWGSFLFALLFWAKVYLPAVIGVSFSLPVADILEMLPYVVTIIVLIIYSAVNKKDSQPPAALGLNYFREER